MAESGAQSPQFILTVVAVTPTRHLTSCGDTTGLPFNVRTKVCGTHNIPFMTPAAMDQPLAVVTIGIQTAACTTVTLTRTATLVDPSATAAVG